MTEKERFDKMSALFKRLMEINNNLSKIDGELFALRRELLEVCDDFIAVM